jgi:hypothetical protein
MYIHTRMFYPPSVFRQPLIYLITADDLHPLAYYVYVCILSCLASFTKHEFEIYPHLFILSGLGM